jgi:hypothetical protein
VTEPRDPGLQPERTALAWQRTGLSAAVTAVLLFRGGLSKHAPLDIAAATTLIVVVVLGQWLSRRRGTAATPRKTLAVATTAVAVAGVLAATQLLTRMP